MKAVLSYNLLRLVVFAGCLAVCFVLGLRGLGLVVVALLVSGVASWFLLARQRVAMGTTVERGVTRARQRFAERTAAEDQYADAVAEAVGREPTDRGPGARR